LKDQGFHLFFEGLYNIKVHYMEHEGSLLCSQEPLWCWNKFQDVLILQHLLLLINFYCRYKTTAARANQQQRYKNEKGIHFCCIVVHYTSYRNVSNTTYRSHSNIYFMYLPFV